MAAKYTRKQFQAQYPDDDACLKAVLQRRYGTDPACPGCGVQPAKLHKITGRRAYACQDCGHHVYPYAGTIFEKSSTKLTDWFYAMYLMTATRNGLSGKELQRQLGVTYKCAWRIGHQLRALMAARDVANNPGPLFGHVEVDETYIGGKKKGDQRKKAKTVVMGLLQRGGTVRAQIVMDAKRASLRPVIAANVERGSTISTDELKSYSNLSAMGYKHGTVNHSAEQYVAGIHHTNSIEGFWSHLKRGIRSTHVSVSGKWMQNYVDEFAFRYNNRMAPADMFRRMLAQVSQSQ